MVNTDTTFSLGAMERWDGTGVASRPKLSAVNHREENVNEAQ